MDDNPSVPRPWGYGSRPVPGRSLFQRCRHGWISLAVWLGAASGLLAFHAHHQAPRLRNYDARAPNRLPPQGLPPEKALALDRLKNVVPGLRWDKDAVLQTPSFVAAPHGLLTGPGGVGKAVSFQALQAIPAQDPHRVIKAFLQDHPALFGYGPELLNSARLKREFVTAHNGLKTVVWDQEVDGITLYGSIFIGHVTKNGELVNLSSRLIPAPVQAADAGTPNRAATVSAPPLSAAQAIVKAAENIGEPVALEQITALDPNPAGAEKRQRFNAGPLLKGETTTLLVWLPMDSQTLRLCWQVLLTSRDRGEMFLMLVDARSGTVLVRRGLTEHITNATYNVYTSDSPSPFSPGHPTPMTGQPPQVQRMLLTLEAVNTNASPNGWINDADNETTGNNVDAHADRDNDNQPDLPRPVGNPTRVFDFNLDLTLDPTTYTEAAIVQLFYWNNWMHDKLWELGFTEAAGNFQANNFGRGGLGNDAVQADAQDGGGFNNANMSTPPDGFAPRMQMYLFDGPNPDRDGDLDAEVVLHEFTHGLSNRRVGGGVGLFQLQSRGMGEGWSDFYGLALLSESADNIDANYAVGGYLTFQFILPGFQENYYYGIRRYPYSTDLTKNPLTLKDIDPTQADPHAGVPFSPIFSPFNPNSADEVHNQGEVWCVTLWDMRANLIRKYGFAVGNQLALQLVTDGMNLSPPDPNFLQARDAILQADLVNSGNANFDDIWQAFAKRGMGGSASSPPSSTTVGVVEAFDLPGLALESAATTDLATGNGNGAIDPNECVELTVVLVNKGRTVASSINATLSVQTPGVLVSQADSPYPSILPAGLGTNLVRFKFYTSLTFVCGTPIEAELNVVSDQDTRTIKVRLETGLIGPAVRFNNDTPVVIPDADPAGIDSTVLVSGFSSALSKVTLSLHITHTFVFDLDVRLIAPDGTSVTLSRQNDFSGDNFGLACVPDTSRTTFDDKATIPIAAATPPYVGTFKPDEPLGKLNGKSGLAVNGLWRLRIIDVFFIDLGTLQCWSLNLFPTLCSDGGGDCSTNLAISGAVTPAVPILGSNLTYTLTVTNRGQNSARNVLLTDTLPPGATFVSATSPNGGCNQAGGTVTCSFGSLEPGSTATAQVTVRPITLGSVTNTAAVSSTTPDPVPANNSVSFVGEVRPPAPLIVDAGALLLEESLSPPTGGIDIGERVSLNLALRNIGSLDTANVVATLLETGGVTQATGPRSYGALLAGGPPATNQFAFTAAGANGGSVAVTLRLADGTNDLGQVVFTFGLGSLSSLTNASRITLPDHGPATNLYPSSIFVSGISGLLNNVRVSLLGVDHTFSDDLDVLLVGPRGETVLLMSDAGGGNGLAGAALTFDDAGAPLPDSNPIASGTYRPTDYESGDAFPPSAPAGPYGDALSIFNGREANGLWSLYVVDDATGDAGRLAGGWGLTLATVDLVNPTADLRILASGSPATNPLGSNVTYTIIVTNSGPDSATGLLLTNLLPAGASFVSATVSQGSFSNASDRLIFSLASLTNQGQATISIVAALTRSGIATNTANVLAAQTDPNPLNSRAVVLTTVSPAADLAVSIAAMPSSAVLGENLIYTVTVTNHGPDTAGAVFLTNSLPAGVTNVTFGSSQGSCARVGDRITCVLGTLPAGGRATLLITNQPSSLSALTNSARVISVVTADLAPANNTASLVTAVTDPFVQLMAAGTTLLEESLAPPTGGIETGETVTLQLKLLNVGVSNTTALLATLLSSGGVTPSSSTQDFGVVVAGDPFPVGRPFTFTASGAGGSTITATLRLNDAGRDLGTLSYPFVLGGMTSLANAGVNSIADNGRAGVYPSTISVTNLAGSISKLSMTLSNLTHAYPDDIDVLLVGPEGQAVLVMSDTGGGSGVNNVTLAFDDDAINRLPDAMILSSGAYQPSDYAPVDAFPAPAPSGPYDTALAVFNGRNPNGTWSLYVVDDTFGDLGFLNNGWSLSLTTVGFINLPLAAPQLSAPEILGDGSFRFVVQGDPGESYTIEASPDLNSWTTIGSVTLGGSSAAFQDTGAIGQQRRFYRARLGP